MKHLFEVSWEVCNKVGGIHTVITSKATAAVAEFGDGYVLLGPLVDGGAQDFVETDEDGWQPIREALAARELKARLGRWEIPGRPRVILVGFDGRYDTDKLLYEYWQQFGVDSLGGGWDYVEPLLFSTACGEVIETIADAVLTEEDEVLAHFHEWMCGGGLLHLKQDVPEVGTVFTTHATVLGRAMAGAGRDVHELDESFRPQEAAEAHGVKAKHLLELACAREADCFTTVSWVTADEAERMLGRRPDRIVYNGLDLAALGEPAALREATRERRGRLLEIAGRFLRKDLPPSTRLWISSGRYEFHNKGYDVLLQALADLERVLAEDPQAPPIVAWFMTATGNAGVDDEVRARVKADGPSGIGSVAVSTHRLYDEGGDPIVRACASLGLRNGPEAKVNVILTPAYLDGGDGIVDLEYYDALAAADLGVFPSCYEPWGYTPLESIALGVPTVTTDLAGFGRWARDLSGERGRGVTIVDRAGRADGAVASDLRSVLEGFAVITPEDLEHARARALQIAARADWREFFDGYLGAYDQAAYKARRRVDSQDTSAFSEGLFISFKGTEGPGPHYRSFTVVTALPAPIAGLREIAQNLWWSWHPEAQELFERIDAAAWEECGHNPVRLLATVSSEVLEERAADMAFVKAYRRVLENLRTYVESVERGVADCEAFDHASPVAYFSMEFCLHECLPIYSGGLGVLAGDHLKSASDLNIPLVGVGLLYRQGYFTQRIDPGGNQLEQYPFLDTSTLPLRILVDNNGDEIRVAVDLAGRTVHARAWEALVGRVRLFLLDPDVEENVARDRQICWRLYGGDRQTRVEQEILLGMGGVALLEDGLGLRPGVYHLNEGHCGFLLFERMRRLMTRGQLTFQEAREAVKASSVFTTHTPVPAGNETFALPLFQQYFGRLAEELGVPWDRIAEMGLATEGDDAQPFSMTVLGLKLTSNANGVSRLHSAVCREMWKDVWKHVAVEEIPIDSITNGVHLTSWIGRGIRRLFGQYTDMRWDENHDDADAWAKIAEIPADRLWYEHSEQKRLLIDNIKRKIVRDYARRAESPQLIRETVERLDPSALTIGFARRFASYKRAYLLFHDRRRLAQLLGDAERPVQILFAGKAHPADRIGKELIRSIVEAARSEDLRGRIVYLENYDMALGRLMTQGVDVWLNTPVRPHEASGTSGMKVLANGGLNCSILDGWWAEAYRAGLGWAIDSGVQYANREHQDEMDSIALLDLLEREIVPLYYDADDRGIPVGWVDAMKEAIATLGPRFTTMRMVKEYYARMYAPAARRKGELRRDDYSGIRSLTAWKRKINARFSTVRIEKVAVHGIDGETLPSDTVLDVEMFVRRGRLEPDEIRAELVIGAGDSERFSGQAEVVPFEAARPVDGTGLLVFHLRHHVEQSGSYRYAVRIVPVHPLLASTQETGLVLWW